MLRRKELLWFYQEVSLKVQVMPSNTFQGADFLFADAFDKYKEVIPVVERGDYMSAYHRRLTGADEQEKVKCARAWTTWEMSTRFA